MSSLAPRSPLVLAVTLLPLALALGCGSSAPAGPPGGPLVDAADQHCFVNGAVAATHVGMCLMPGAAGEDAAAAHDADADAGDDADAHDRPATIDYGPSLYNSSGYDDDCKYHVSFTSTPIRKNADVTFTVTVEGLDPAGAATNAHLYAEVYLSDIHPAPNSNPKTTETPPGSGIYQVGPIVFDASGIWTVRFHMYEMCSDAPEDSPHGHAAFYIEVP